MTIPWPRAEFLKAGDGAGGEGATAGMAGTAGSTMVWGHRGASSAEVQNSPAAFVRALEFGATGVELDIRRTADGVLVVHHDADMADGRLIVETEAGDLPEHVPTLAWVLDLYTNHLVNIEVKSGPAERDYRGDYLVVDLLLGVLAESDPESRHIVTSFDEEVLVRIRESGVASSSGLITSDPRVKNDLGRLVDAGHAAVMLDRRLVDEAVTDDAHQRGLFVGAWTVNDPYDMRRFAELGVDAIMTDVPDVAVAALSTIE